MLNLFGIRAKNNRDNTRNAPKCGKIVALIGNPDIFNTQKYSKPYFENIYRCTPYDKF